MRTVLTAERLVLHHPDGTSIAIRHSDPVELIAYPTNRRLQLHIEGGPVLAFQGEWVPYLTVALVYARTGEILALDAVPVDSAAVT